ncbi:MAG TPA: periplasmic heavy metal sensor [Candidatus Aminicenantes bacterium]|nr:periplasmic heavy metal sensor [Candidatus Aminicenantes bacterium]
MINNHNKFWIIFSFILVFVIGIIGGIIIDKLLFCPPSFSPPPPEQRGREGAHFPTLEMMAQELNLTPEQQEQIRQVFQNNDQRLRNLHKEVMSQLREIRTQLKEEINAVLDEEQEAKFDLMIKKYLEQRKKEWDRRRKRPSEQRKPEGDKK